MVSAITMTYVEEAIGIDARGRRRRCRCAISFTVETDGRLPTGQSLLGEAIEAVDAATGDAPAYYMINCAHPTHFAGVLEHGRAGVDRIRGLRANASTRATPSSTKRPSSTSAIPRELGAQYRELRRPLPQLTVLGGCCGTDHRHVEAICTACLAA